MSHVRAQSGGLRAVSAVAAICALVFALLVSGSTRGGHLVHAQSSAEGAVACHNLGGELTTNKSSQPARGGDHIDCGQCCLAAVAGAAVLPGRVATLSRPPQLSSSPVRYSAGKALKLKTAAPPAVNGARAPPAPVAAA